MNECPFCGDTTGFYRKGTFKGKYEFHYKFDGRPGDNYHLHDGASYAENSSCFCSGCNKKLPKEFQKILAKCSTPGEKIIGR